MILGIYSIRDELAGNFGNLMVINEKVIQRTCKWMADEMEKKDCDDKKVYRLGQYDTETGEIKPEQPKIEFNLEEAKNG
jgi:hypothetical protein